MKRNTQASSPHPAAVLWTPWGPVPDRSGTGGKVAALTPREQSVRHKRIGFDHRPADTHPTKQ